MNKRTLFRTLFFALVSVLIFLCSCKSANTQGQEWNQAKKTAIAKLGNEIDLFPNSAGTYVLYIQKPYNPNPLNVLMFIIVQTSDNEVVYEKTFVPGYVKWITDSTIEILSVPGSIKENEGLSDFKRIIDIRANKR